MAVDNNVQTQISSRIAVADEYVSVSAFRRVLPQILASMCVHMLYLNAGIALAFPAILIPVLRGLREESDTHETIHFTKEQASWYGSLLFLTEPLGSICSGWINEQIGRKHAIMLGCVPFSVAWMLLFSAQSVEQVFTAGITLGFGMGMLAPIYTYVSEISQPSIRGIMLGMGMLTTMMGLLLLFTVGTWLTWRNSALVAFCVPIASACAFLFIPETPHWLIASNRVDEARNSLRWLRGWVPGEAVDNELCAIVKYIDAANACENCQKLEQALEKCTHASGYYEKLKDLIRLKTLRPFSILLICFVVIHCSGNIAIRPFLVQVFATFELPLSDNWGLMLFSSIDILSCLFCSICIPKIGKRPIFLFALLGVALSCFAISINALVTFPLSTSSFDLKQTRVGNNFAGLIFFMCLGVTSSVSSSIPWMLKSEFYPFRIRGTATGITSALAYMFVFVATKTYINVERSLSIAGGFFLYGTITAVGLVILYNILPETEGKTLAEIEGFFSDKTRTITDRQIRPIGSKVVDVDVTKIMHA